MSYLMKRTGRRALFAAAAILVATSVCAANVQTPVTANYQLIFDEEFNGDILDTSKWNYNWFAPQPLLGGVAVVDQFSRREDAAYSSQQVYVRDGVLHLKLEARPTEVRTAIGAAIHPYVSGMIQTRGKFEMTYGYIETRMYVPSAPSGVMANWPAFWAVNSRGARKEIDVVEGLAGQAQYHYHDQNGAFPREAVVPGDHTGWHVYGAYFDSKGARFYIDGQQIGAVRRSIPDNPVYLVLDQAAQNGVGGPDVAPAEVMFDYVHAYTREPCAPVQAQQGYGGPGDAG